LVLIDIPRSPLLVLDAPHHTCAGRSAQSRAKAISTTHEML